MEMSKRKALLYGTILTFGLGTLYLGLSMKNSHPPEEPNSWDLIIFTQTWPQTLCYTWEENNPHHTCNFPKQKNLWTVHGLWPTKLGTIGPAFCNKSISFDPKALYSIEEQIHEYWVDIEQLNNETEVNISKNTISHKKESIWFHEWEKHGTCALTLPSLNSEFEYFNQGIKWSEMYNMKDILEKGDIKVNDTTSLVTDYWKAIESVLKTNAWIECAFKSDTKQQMLLEIRICFDKSLKMVNCNGICGEESDISKDHLLTNCDLNKPILYLDSIPKNQKSSINPGFNE
ncbi:Ribonuclease T2, His active site 1,Ribonuclease T2-like,Ribonuclease T2, His active site 2 [Cinara cedri]|uniref:Ribonuclease T2, His active site 1,Ribonuclease T2-like,Ribonuclease T2, His active site 2 n=1 Tax=Cinara cedri TaxID=506608 RepID=A0A5E4N158_9HEMI|nr:Ribonuclease T2, His active site 1,Ribonuclease T2-like,Ribonuclease T2, His active site 2 [Cinara cedri]